MARGWRWLIIILGLLGLALALQAGLVAFAGYVLLGVYLLSRYLAKTWITELSADLECSTDPLEVGDTLEVVARLENRGRIPIAWVLVETLLTERVGKSKPRLTVKGRRIAVVYLKPEQTKPLKFQITFISRGYYPIGPTVAETGDVFGLHRRHRLLAAPRYVMVYPKMLPIRRYDFASERPIGEIRLANMLFEDPTRTAGVRPYMLGDPLQRVHWRATARTGELHSRIYEPTSLAGATILVDFHTNGYPKRGEPTRSDLAVTTACSLAYAVSLLNQQVGFVSNGRDAAERIRDEALTATATGQPEEGQATRTAIRDPFALRDANDRLRPVVVETRRGFDQFQQIRESLARLELTDGMTFDRLVLYAGPRIPRDATVIAVLPQVPVESALALGMLRRQGFAISAILIGFADDGSDARAQAAGRLLSEGIRDVRFINSESELMTLGERSAPGLDSYSVAVNLA